MTTASSFLELPALERVLSKDIPDFQDDSDAQSLSISIDRSLSYYHSIAPDRTFRFGPDVYTASEMITSLELFRSILLGPKEAIRERLRDEFAVYRSTGATKRNEVVFSAYYEHVMPASLKQNHVYRYPLYRPPSDLVKKIDPAHPETPVWGRRADGNFVPYYSREEIDSNGILRGQNLEIAWAKDPMDIFFLQVQGSGWLVLPDGKRVRIRYAANNGQPYVSVGSYMLAQGIIPRNQFSRETMLAYMKSHPDRRQELLNQNPRYVFFELNTGKDTEPMGALRVSLTPGRSIATDHSIFPAGGLCWMVTEGRSKVSRFVLNQDQGGAIKGPGRVDFFVGAGKEAESFAVGFWEKGGLYFLVKKRSPR